MAAEKKPALASLKHKLSQKVLDGARTPRLLAAAKSLQSKTALDVGAILNAVGSGGMAGGVPGLVLGAATGWRGGRERLIHDILVNTAVAGVPAALISGYNEYRAQRSRDLEAKKDPATY